MVLTSGGQPFDYPGLGVRAEDSSLIFSFSPHIRGVGGFEDEVVGGHVPDGPEGALGAHLFANTIVSHTTQGRRKCF